MERITDDLRCTGCEACSNVCPLGCIFMQPDTEGFFRPSIDQARCIECGKCVQTCPVNRDQTPVAPLQAYGSFSLEENVRRTSSSGGVFFALAASVLRRGGVVFGAAYSDDYYSVSHIAVERSDDLWRLQTSKYVQSRISDSYLRAAHFLRAGRLVYFSGTPCQIAGLKAYLGKNFDNLITQDIICHGIPSPSVWTAYLQHIEAEAGARICNLTARSKEYGWRRYALSCLFTNERRYIQPNQTDPYLLGFQRNLFLRNSCHACNFKEGKSGSDLTIGDFWGLSRLLPHFDAENGVSLVLVNTDQGRALFEAAAERLLCEAVEPEKALSGNPAYARSAVASASREAFFASYSNQGVVKAIELCLKKNETGIFRRSVTFLRCRLLRRERSKQKRNSVRK